MFVKIQHWLSALVKIKPKQFVFKVTAIRWTTCPIIMCCDKRHPDFHAIVWMEEAIQVVDIAGNPLNSLIRELSGSLVALL